MRLYTIQSLEVVYLLYQYKIYFPSFEKADWLQDGDLKEAFEFPYSWMTEQYNKRKNQDFSSSPVWWYTNYNEAVKHLKTATNTNEVLIRADVPDKLVLLHDADLWERGPFVQLNLGWLGHPMELTDNWEGTKFQKLFDAVWDAYKKNDLAVIQTWENIFNITRSNPPERIHATTQFIDFYWLEKKQKHETQSSEM